MAYNRIVISSGHGLYVRGASGILDEVDEARLVVEQLADALRNRGVDVVTFHDDVSTSQNENLNRIVDFHNAQVRDLDVSIHFNASEQTSDPRGTEVFYETQRELAAAVSAAIAAVGFKDRGAKTPETSLFFLSNTAMPAILVEVCFVDSEADAEIYNANFIEICENIANLVSDPDIEAKTAPPSDTALFYAVGPCSYFGGPDDTTGVSADEGLAFIDAVEDAPHLFLPYQPEGSTGLARRLNPWTHYLACRWDYSVTPKETLLQHRALVRALRTGRELTAFPADWGPAGPESDHDTGRVADLSPSLMEDLGIETDDEVEIVYPFREDT